MRAWYSLPAALLGAGLLLGTGAEAQTTERVSVASGGAEANGRNGSFPASGDISADGRIVVFESLANNLVAGDRNDDWDVFLHDLDTGITERVSVASDGSEGNDGSFEPSISADGRFVAFDSSATNLVAGDTNGFFDVFVLDRDSATIERVSVDDLGLQGDGDSAQPSISSDGRFVAFASDASNLIDDDTNDATDIFVHDRDTGITVRVSISTDHAEGNSRSLHPDLSANGRLVAFQSASENLVADDSNSRWDLFVHDRETGATERVSIASDGTQGDSPSTDPAISANGHFVAFWSSATNLVPDDTNDVPDVFVHDRVTRTTARVSNAGEGTQGNRTSWFPQISSDGRFVAFESFADNLVSGDTNAKLDVFIHDRVTVTTERISVASDGAEGNDNSTSLVISADGRFVAFHSEASNLVVGDTNLEQDYFVRDRGAPPQLVVAGTCPGSVSLSLTNATPEGQVAFGWGSGEGAFTLPAGACAGAAIGLADPHPLIVLTADQDGAISRNENLGAGACGRLLQALDVATCMPSNVAGLP